MSERATPRVESALMVVNRPAGNGHATATIERLRRAFDASFGWISRRVFAVTQDHEQVYQETCRYLAETRGPCFLLAGGGGGTNRAMVQALMEAAEQGTVRPEEVCVSALRMGSGNLVPIHLGLPREPVAALGRIAADLFAGRTRPCCVYCCSFHGPGGATRHVYGLTMGGLGQFGRVPDDVRRWRDRHPGLMRWLARVISLERANTWQYLGFSLLRAARCALQPGRAELVELRGAGRKEQLRLLAGVLLNFDFPQMPLRSGCAIDELRLALCLIPYAGRWQTLRAILNLRGLKAGARTYSIAADQPIEIRFPAQQQTTLALDEDTFTAPARVSFAVAGQIQFVAGTGGDADSNLMPGRKELGELKGTEGTEGAPGSRKFLQFQ